MNMICPDISLVDSLPIIVASQKRSSQAKVASQICDKTFCASKGIWYYGVKLHLVGWKQIKSIPFPEFVGLTPASEHDLHAFKRIAFQIKDRAIFADKAYFDKELKEHLESQNCTKLNASIKRVRGQLFEHSDDKIFSTLVSKVRQPLESFFNWLHEKTAIQKACKVRSAVGLSIHVFGKMAAAIFLIAFRFLNP